MSTKVQITRTRLDSLADAIALKSDIPAPLTIDEMISAVANIGIDSNTPTVAGATITPTTTQQTAILAGYAALGDIIVEGDANLVASNIKSGVSIFGVSGSYVATPTYQTKTATPTESEQIITPDAAYDGLSQVTVGAVSSSYVGTGVTRQAATTYTPTTSDQTIAANTYLTGTQTISGDANLIAGNIKSGTTIFGVSGTYAASANYQSKSATPTESEQTITADNAYDALSQVTISAISSTYVGSGVTRKAAATFTPSTLTQTIAADTYLTGAQTISGDGNLTAANIRSGTTIFGVTGTYAPSLQAKTGITPTESSQTITPEEGYDGLSSVQINAISSTYVGSGITSRSSSDLTASGATVTAPAGYYATAATKTITSGTVTAPASISGTAATVSTGTNTLTLSKSISVTPSVTTAGYISSGTASNASVSLTASVTTKAAATITPTTSNQTIAADTYLTGAQTIAGDANLVASNILSGVSIFGVSGSVSFQTIYSGSSAPSASLGNDGDVYIQTT